MQHCHCHKALDMTIRDIYDSPSFFGGITLVFGGEFCQILLVVPKGPRAQLMEPCLYRSSLWAHMQIMKPTINMRKQVATMDNKGFLALLLEVGDDSDVEGDNTLLALHHCVKITLSLTVLLITCTRVLLIFQCFMTIICKLALFYVLVMPTLTYSTQKN